MMKGLLLTLLTPSAFAQLQMPASPLEAPPAAASVAPLSNPELPAVEVPIGAGLGLDSLPLSPLESLPAQSASLPAASPLSSRLASPIGAGLGKRDGSAPLSRLESLAAPASREADPGSLHSAFFDLNARTPDALSGLGAAPETLEAPGPTAAETGALGRMYPRVAVILDVLKGKAQDSTLRLIDLLQQQGVRVVFVTSRPARGAGSVEEVLTRRLPRRMTNPLLIASSSGAKIYALSSKAKNPRPTIPNAPSFSSKEWALIDKAVLETARQRRLEGIHAPGRPDSEAYSYKGTLPGKANAETFAKQVNAKLRSAGLPYRAETNGQSFSIRAYRTHLAVPRIIEALRTVLHRDVRERPQEILVIADPKRSAAFLKAFPKGTYVQAVSDEGSLAKTLSAVLGSASLEKVSVNRSKLRSYLEYLRRKEPKTDFSGGSGSWDRTYDRPRDLDFYKGVLLYELMGRLYRDMRNGEFQVADREHAEARLRSMWENPKRNYVRLPAQLQRTAANLEWRKKHRKAFNGALIASTAWIRNYYERHFPNWPVGLVEQVIQNIVNLSSDGMSLITVELKSPFTGRRYLIHHRPARAEIRRSPEGPLLVAEAYRFGREKAGLPDETEAKLLAMAMVKGYTRKVGNDYLLNGKPVRQVLVNIEYLRRTVPYLIDIADLPKAESEIVSLIERMEADAAFQRQYKKDNEEEQPASKKAKNTAKKTKRRSS